MIVRPARAPELASRSRPMTPGDLLLTGTPGGTALTAPAKPVSMLAAGRRPPPGGGCSSAARHATRPARRRRHLDRDGHLRPDGGLDLGTQAQHSDRKDAMTTTGILPPPTSTYQLLLDAARTWPDNIATQWIPDPGAYTDGLAWTYTGLARTVTQIANALTALGVRRTDAVTLSAPNTSMLYAATLAAQAVGIAAPVNPALSDEHLTALIRRAGSRIVVTAGPELNEQLWQRMLQAAARLG